MKDLFLNEERFLFLYLKILATTTLMSQSVHKDIEFTPSSSVCLCDEQIQFMHFDAHA